ncbi:hypothetical protein [Eubacterium aggregans]|uniref:hypothetical protein n=1 Tax=Eubacterium aggregans TaxID=81409 RepID=UPI003F2E499D
MIGLLLAVTVLTECTPDVQAKRAVDALYTKEGTDITEDLMAKEYGRFAATRKAVDALKDDDQKKELNEKIQLAQKMVDVQAKVD